MSSPLECCPFGPQHSEMVAALEPRPSCARLGQPGAAVPTQPLDGPGALPHTVRDMTRMGADRWVFAVAVGTSPPVTGTTLKESVCFETISGSDIDLAVGDSWSGKMTDRRQLVASIGGLIRRIEQIERNRVKGKELTGDDPQNSVAVTIGGNE